MASALELLVFPIEPPAIHRLAEVKVPTLIIVGNEDLPYPLEIGNLLEQGIVGAQKVVLSDAAHHPNMEKTEEFNRTVMEFLNKS